MGSTIPCSSVKEILPLSAFQKITSFSNPLDAITLLVGLQDILTSFRR